MLTGASSGIGRAIAIQLVRAGNQVLALARRQDRLEILAEELKDASGTLQFLLETSRIYDFAKPLWIGLNNIGSPEWMC